MKPAASAPFATAARWSGVNAAGTVRTVRRSSGDSEEEWERAIPCMLAMMCELTTNGVSCKVINYLTSRNIDLRILTDNYISNYSNCP